MRAEFETEVLTEEARTRALSAMLRGADAAFEPPATVDQKDSLPAIPAWAREATEQQLVDFIEDVDLNVAEYKEHIAKANAMRDMIKGEIERRLRAENRKVVVHERFTVTLKAIKDRTALKPELYAALQELVAAGKVTAEDAKKACWVVPPSTTVVYGAHLGRVDDLTKKYGDVVAPVIRRCVISGPESFEIVMAPKKLERNVTPDELPGGVI